MRDDLDKAEQRWRNRSLFVQPRRRRLWPWLLLLGLLGGVVMLLYPDLIPYSLHS